MASPRASPLMMLLGAIFFFTTHVFAVSAVLGVDLGTEYIKASLVKPGIPLEIVLTKDSRRKETAAVAFKPPKGGPKEGEYPERAYGADAMAIAARFPGDVYPNLKALLGLNVEDPAVVEYAARHPALSLEAHTSKRTVSFKSKALTPEVEPWTVEELLAIQLQSIRKNAEVAAGDGTSVQSIVLTVPPFYTLEEKRAIQTAAELANLKVLSLVSDGLAVGLNYALTRQFPNINEGEKPEYHMVYDMGAGSTKATVLRFQSRNVKDVGKFNKTVQEIQVLGSGWDRTLGGDALNYLIVDDMLSQFVESKAAQKASVTLEAVKAHGRAVAKLSKDAERVRQVLSANQNTGASFEGLYEDIDFKYKLTRADFETLAEPHAKRLGVVFNEALKAADLDVSDLTSVIMHGGASRTPFVQKVLEDAAGSADKVRSNVNADEAAVLGAGFRAAELSPSFRVKEIRILEGSMYPSGIKWTKSNNMLQHQRLWTSVSPLGGPAKELTFNDLKDFSATFYQQVDSEDQDIAVVTTKNLTASADALKEKYPSCTDADIQFKLGVKLRGDNGEVEIVKAAVECEAEVTEKEGFVDGVKNLFGFGKKDQQPLKGEDEGPSSKESEKSKSTKKGAKSSSTSSTKSSESSSTASDKDAKATPAGEDAKPEIKKQLVSIPVKFGLEKAGTPQFSTDEFTKAKDRLKAFAASDKARMLREEALNQLEGYTYKVRDLLESETFIEASTEAERSQLSKTLGVVSEWLYEDGVDASRAELKAKLKELEDLAFPIVKRRDESAQRPELVAALKGALNQTVHFIGTIRDQIDEYEAFHAAEAAKKSEAAEPAKESPADDDLEDEDATEKKERTMDDLKKEIGPVPPMYQREDLEEVEGLHKEVAAWLKELEVEQDALPSTADPVLLIQDLKAKRQALDKAGKDLALKAVRNFEKKKKATQSAGDKKKSKTKSADPAQQTIKFGDGEKMPTQEELEELIAKLKLQTEKDEKKDEKTDEKKDEKEEKTVEEDKHDEL
ncbi:Hypoxia up-regulated protein 1 [Paramyrothecium foliicola]|nr:Hypoxia up-regulated protein 1 [Paramyrothecium foliicola]